MKYKHIHVLFGLGFLALCTAMPASATETTPPPVKPVYGTELQGFAYPFPQQHFHFVSQGQKLQMGFMDVAPTGTPNGQTVVLLHGKNFCGATWEGTIRFLTGHGYRVIAPDQIGFCSSTKPAYYQYTFQQLAANTRALIKSRGVDKIILLGHSTGGMLATRFALMYPEMVSHLELLDPVGLEDWAAKGVPYVPVEKWYAGELKKTAAGIRKYEQKTYYAGKWDPSYQKWVDMLAGLYNGSGRELVAWNSALIYNMIQTQPVVYEFKNLKVPTTLMVGDKDITAIGKAFAPPAVQKTLGHYEELGHTIIKQIPHGHLIVFHGLGHAPQIAAPEMFHKALLKDLQRAG